MSDPDDLRVRLAQADPARILDPVESQPAPELLERIMSAPVITEAPSPASPRRRWPLLSGIAAAAAAVLIAVLVVSGGSSPTPAKTTLSLQLAPSNVISSCIMFSTDILKDMSPAFEGTVVTVDEAHVVLDVDHWYAGGTQDQVSLAVAQGATSAGLEGGVEFVVGKQYLITAAEGTVNGCGYSGESTPDLKASFDQAFGAK